MPVEVLLMALFLGAAAFFFYRAVQLHIDRRVASAQGAYKLARKMGAGRKRRRR
jgi:hypothetical protein